MLPPSGPIGVQTLRAPNAAVAHGTMVRSTVAKIDWRGPGRWPAIERIAVIACSHHPRSRAGPVGVAQEQQPSFPPWRLHGTQLSSGPHVGSSMQSRHAAA